MCAVCDGICPFFEALVAAYFRAVPHPPAFEVETSRRTFMSMELPNAPDAATETRQFADLIDHADLIGMSPDEFRGEIATRSGLTEQVGKWAMGIMPNGWARKLILTNAEDIIRERGAHPELSLLAA